MQRPPRGRTTPADPTPFTVFVRALHRLIGKLPYDAHATPTLRVTAAVKNTRPSPRSGIDPASGMPIAGYNHGWSGGALVQLSQYVAGLSPTAPGWASFDVRPQLGSTLHNASARIATPFGHVGVDVTRHEAVATAAAAGGGGGGGDKRLRVRLSVPDGTVARLVLPFSMGRVAS